MILPGEVAPAHRHVSSAIRFVLDGDGAYTAVEGEKAYMSPGDFLITANWAPHDHGNTSKQPMLWLDVLDFPQVNFFEASFAEEFGEATQSTNRSDGTPPLSMHPGPPRRSAGAHEPQSGDQLHLCTYPADHRAHDEGGRHRQAPWRARALCQSDQWGTGAADHECASRSVSAGLQGREIPRDGWDHLRVRRRQGHDHHRWQGAGMGPERCFRDSAMESYAHTASKELVLFSISDRPSQEALGIWREDKSLH